MKSVKLLFPKSANKEFTLNSTSAVNKYCATVKNYNKSASEKRKHLQNINKATSLL